MDYLLNSEDETAQFGAAMAKHLRGGDCVLLLGDLGSGKSVLARGIARALGVEGPMPSPTYTLAIPYTGNAEIVHMDLYRLSDADEFFAAGLQEYLNGDAICLIEWPLDALNCPTCIQIAFERAGETARRVRLTLIGMDARAANLLSALRGWAVDA